MALVNSCITTISLLDSANKSVVPDWAQSLLSTTYTLTGRPQVLTFPATTTPTTYTINGLSGTSPVKAVICNTSTTAVATVLGVAGFTQGIDASDWIKVSQLVTTSNITVSVATGTADIVVILLD